MTGEFSDRSGGYYKDDAALLAAILNEHGPKAAFENAERIAAELNKDPVDMMRGVVVGMYGDPSNHIRALDYLQWDAEANPDVAFAVELSGYMHYYSRYEESREFAIEATGAAVVHLLNAAQKPDFVADMEYVEAANSILNDADARGLNQQYDAALEAVAPHIVAVMQKYLEDKKDGDKSGTDFGELELNMFLSTISGTVHRSNPEIADAAQAAMTDKNHKVAALESRSEKLIIDTLLAGDFDSAKDFIKDTKSNLYMLWWALQENAEQGADGREIAAKSIDTLLEVRPDYFVDYKGSSAVDIYFGSTTGRVLALADRSEHMEPLIHPTSSPKSAWFTVRGCAYALGQTNNQQAYEAMLQMPNAKEYAETIRLNFKAGLKDPVS